MWWRILKQTYEFEGQPMVTVYPSKLTEEVVWSPEQDEWIAHVPRPGGHPTAKLQLKPEIISLKELDKTIQDVPENLRDLIGKQYKDTDEPSLAYYRSMNIFFDQNNPNSRAMYTFLPDAMSSIGRETAEGPDKMLQFIKIGARSDWLIYPKETGEEVRNPETIPTTNWSGLFFLIAQDNAAYLMDVNWNAAAHGGAEGGICVYRRGKILPLNEYTIGSITTEEVQTKEPRQRPTSRLLEGLTRSPAKIKAPEGPTKESNIAGQAKVIHDFISDITIINTGPEFPGVDNNTISRMAKVCLMMGRSGTSDRVCIGMPSAAGTGGRAGGHGGQWEGGATAPRGDVAAALLKLYDMAEETVRQMGAGLVSHAPHHYPLEETMKQLEVQFPGWDPNNPQKVLLWFENKNYLLGQPRRLPGTP